MKSDFRKSLFLLYFSCVLTFNSVMIQDWRKQSLIFGISFLVLLYAHNFKFKGLLSFFKRLKVLISLLFSVSLLQMIFRQTGDVYFDLHLLKITADGVNFSLIILFRYAIIFATTLSLATISYANFLFILSGLKLPYELTFTVSTTLKLIPQFAKEVKNYRDNLQLNNIRMDKLPIKDRFLTLKYIIIFVFLSAMQSLRLQTANLELRAFRKYPTRTSYFDQKLTFTDLMLFIPFLLLGIGLYLL